MARAVAAPRQPRRPGRVISQAGDSTDGEDYEDQKNDYWIDRISRLSNHASSKYPVSHALKSLGECILQSPQVREKYVELKKQFVETLTNEQRERLVQLDQKLGRGWGVLNSYDRDESILDDQKTLEKYFYLNHQVKRQVEPAEGATSPADAADLARLDLEACLGDFAEIQELHRHILQHAETQYGIVEPRFNQEHRNPDASLYLAKLKGRAKLDKDLGKNDIYDFRGNGDVRSEIETRVNKIIRESLTVWPSFKISHCLENTIGERYSYNYIKYTLKEFQNIQHIDLKLLARFFKAALRGKTDTTICGGLPQELRDVLKDELLLLMELIFGIEVKRNRATLMTAPMFFDLIKRGMYQIDDLPDKLPMAPTGSVAGSCTIDAENIPANPSWQRRPLDYRRDEDDTAAEELADRDWDILSDWLILKGERVENNEAIVTATLLHDLIRDWYGISLASLANEEMAFTFRRPMRDG